MNQYLVFLNNRKILWIVSLLILTIYFLPYFIHGKDVPLIVYDNLDSNVIWFKILAESGKIFADSMDIIPNMMNGLPRLSYGSEFNVTLWLYYFFDTFTAYVINDILVHFFAFIGMFLLLSRYIIHKQTNNYNLIIFSVSLFFALLPFWSNGGLSVAGQPLALYAFLNIRVYKDNKWDWIILIFLPFYSYFVLSFLFFIFIVGLIFLYDLYMARQINKRFMFSMILMTSIYLLVEYRLVYNMLFDSGYVSHRTTFDLFIDSYDQCLTRARLIFLKGQDHNYNLQFYYVLPTIIIALFLSLKPTKFNLKESLVIIILIISSFIINIWWHLLTADQTLPLLLVFSIIIWLYSKDNKLFSFLFIIQIVISYWTGFQYSTLIDQIADIFPILHSLHLRFMMLQSLLWYILLAFSLQVLSQKLYLSLLVILSLLISQISLSFDYKTFKYINKPLMSFNAYYETELYSEIDTYIGQPKSSYRIANIGLNPAISLYNGFYTIDGYAANYPLSYKYKFRNIISEHLDSLKKHQGDAFVFDDWGSKVYIFTGQHFNSIYNNNLIFKDLSINTKQISLMNTKYIFSAYEISNYHELNLRFLKKFNNPHNNWPVYLYKIKEYGNAPIKKEH